MSYVLEIEVKGLPKTANGSHGNYHAANTERKKWRTAVSMVAYYRRPPTPLVKSKLILTRCSTTEPDADNLAISFKGAVDGLKDAKVIVDDSPKHVTRLYLWKKAKRGEGKIIVRVEEVAS